MPRHRQLPDISNPAPKSGSRRTNRLFLLGLAPLLVGCATHPLPENVTRSTTYDIVERIRCEAKRAVLDHGRGFVDAALAYEFTFQITEDDNASGNATWTLPFLNGGSFSLVANAGLTKTRDAARIFKLVDSFAELRRARCDGEVLEKNWIYPIAGDIGVYEVVSTFARLHKVDNPIKGSKDDVFSFADTLVFTTVLGGGVKPKLTLAPVTEKFRLTEANGDFSAGRRDMHKVVLALAAGQQIVTTQTQQRRAVSRIRSMVDFAPLTGSSSPLSVTILQTGANAKESALMELDRQRILELQRRSQTLLVTP
jgi:hypothetical protein